VTLTFDDDILLAALGEALAPEVVEPGFDELAALHRALETWPADTDDNDDVRLAPVIPMFVPSNRSVTWARIHRLRHPVAAAVAVGILATSGVAAAGVATDRLPGPARNVAYALGLPVTSPALESASGTMVRLGAALADHDAVQVRASATLLHTQMAGLSATDLTQIQTPATDLLVQAYVFLVAAAASQGAAAGAAGTSGGTGLSQSTGSVSSAGPVSSNSPTSGGTTSQQSPANVGSDRLSGVPPIVTTPVTSPPTSGGSGGTTSGTGSPGTTVAHPSATPGTSPTTTTITRPDGPGSGDHGSDDGGTGDHISDDHASNDGSFAKSSDGSTRKWRPHRTSHD
jgi:hypothetical protein